MSDLHVLTPAQNNCWSDIGVWGNGTCSELPRVSHCRNCDVYAASGRRLLDRLAPADYIESWTTFLAEEKVTTEAETTSYLVFRVGHAWFSFPATSFREITERRPIRSVPHRPRDILLGLVNVRGELYPCVSLHKLFGEEPISPTPRTARFLVARRSGEDWVFPVDQVDGMHDVAQQHIEPVPATLANAPVVYTQGLFRYKDQTVAIIDEDLLFGALVRGIA
jgi:chemotaxis-related protein WspD